MFRTTVRIPATFKEELSSPRETLKTAGWFNIPLFLVGSALLVSTEATANCVAQMGALNTAEPMSDGYTK